MESRRNGNMLNEVTWGMKFRPAKSNLMKVTNSRQVVIRPYTEGTPARS